MSKLKYKENIILRSIDNITGEVIKEKKVSNIVVTSGLSRIANLINGGSTNAFDYIAIGTGTTTEVVGDTALETEVERELATVSEDPTGTAKWQKTFTVPSGTSYSITEVGVFDQATQSGSTMMNRSTDFSAFTLDVDTDLDITVTLELANC